MRIVKIGDSSYPKKLLELRRPPKKLYVEGNESLLNNTSLAIVGSRKCSEYGIKYAEKFSRAIASAGITIVSGLAIGIDSIAHKVAKEYKGNTIAVLGSGLNYVYPEENKELFDDILKSNGCIISEYAPNEQVNMRNFPKRNRMISGIAMGILVIEAGYRSGSTITARYGFKQNKKVFCLPRDIGISNGVGTNELIQNGAMLVTTPKDILQEFSIEYFEKESDFKLQNPKIKKAYQDIYNLLSYTPQNIEYLSKRSGLTISQVNQKLTILELEGHIQSLPGNYYVRS